MSTSPTDTETEKFLNRRAENIKTQRNKKRAAVTKAKRQQVKLMQNYMLMSMDEKFDFALRGYCFENNPDVPAI
jgi:hypothetical protein